MSSQVKFCHSVVSDYFRPHGLLHAGPAYPSPAPRVYSNSCPSSPWSILFLPLLLLPSIFPSIRVFFQWVSSSHQVAKVLEFQLQHQSFQWTPRMISFRMDWLDLLAVQGTLKSLLQCHSLKASILRRSAFFMVQLSHDYWKYCRLYGPLSAEWYLCLLICYLGLSSLSFQGASVF